MLLHQQALRTSSELNFRSLPGAFSNRQMGWGQKRQTGIGVSLSAMVQSVMPMFPHSPLLKSVNNVMYC